MIPGMPPESPNPPPPSDSTDPKPENDSHDKRADPPHHEQIKPTEQTGQTEHSEQIRYNYYTSDPVHGMALSDHFEFDSVKSALNVAKHGIDFVEAQRMWLDDKRYHLPMRFVHEPRFGIVACIGETVWTGIFTMRNDKIRIISVRRARHDERKLRQEGTENHDG